MRHFCTAFDRNFLTRGLALYRSLEAHAGDFRLWVLCFDDATLAALRTLAWPGLEPIALADFEAGNPDLVAVKPSRTRIEYYFTCSPSLPLYVFSQDPAIDLVTYLDADLYFHASPQPLFDELGAQSILIVAHRFPPAQREMEKYGRFNVGFLSFRNDAAGLACLDAWRAQCIDWCYDRVEPDRYADQKYLDTWPARYSGVVVSRLKGANLAPWNVFGYQLAVVNERVTVDGEPLIFYHFHQLKMLGSRICDPGLWRYGPARGFNILRDRIYRPYLAALDAASNDAVAAQLSAPAARYGVRSVIGGAAQSLVRGQLLVAPGGFGR